MEINEINQWLKDWKVESLIGQGSFGKVYLAKREIVSDTLYAAIKSISIPQTDSQIAEEIACGQTIDSLIEYFRGIVEDWQTEIKMLEKLKGVTNIVGIEDYQIIEHPDKLHWDILIRMEYLTPFSQYVTSHPMKVKDALKLGIDICQGLEYCERQKIIHRDIKPENIFISRFGDFKLGDFGIARQIEKTTSNLSKKGTQLYMAPEVYRGEDYNHTVDIYSLGLMLYRLFNQNKLPFIPLEKGVTRFSDKENSVVQRMRGVEFPNPFDANPEISRIIKKACAFISKDRYQTASEMLIDLRIAYDAVSGSEDKVIISIQDPFAKESSLNASVKRGENTEEKSDNSEKTFGLQSTFTPQNNTSKDESKNEHDPLSKIDDTDKTTGLFSVITDVIEKEEIADIDMGDESEVLIAEKRVETRIESTQNQISRHPNPRNKSWMSNRKTWVIIPLIIVAICLSWWYFGTQSSSTKTVVVPNVVSMQRDAAIEKLENLGLKVVTVNVVDDDSIEGTVKDQSSIVDTELKQGDEVTITIYVHSTLVTVPNLVGLSLDDAKTKLEELNLVCESTTIIDDTKSIGVVTSQSVANNVTINSGEKVILTVVAHSAKVTVPNLVGLNITTAKEKISELGLNFQLKTTTSDKETPNIVYQQSIAKDSSVKVGSIIVISIYVKTVEVAIPTGVGTSSTTYETKLASLGLKASISQKYSDTTASGKIISISPSVGTKVAPGSTVALVVSKGASTFGEWVTQLPTGITDAKYIIESKTQYRSQDIELTTSNVEPLSGWTKYGEKISTYGAWSYYTEWPKTASKFIDVDPIPLVKYRVFHYAYNSSDSLCGEISYWLNTTDFPWCASQTVYYETLTSTSSFTLSYSKCSNFQTQYCMSGGVKYYYFLVSPSSTTNRYLATTNMKTGALVMDGKYTTSYTGFNGYFARSSIGDKINFYRYRTIEWIFNYSRGKGNWSEWQFNEIIETNLVNDVETRTVYRYREK